MSNNSLYIPPLIVLLLWFGNTRAQDIESVVKSDPIKINGSVSASTTYYNALGIDNRRPPFYWTINANLNISLFGVVSAPFSLQFSPQGNQFNYPYQQLQPFNKMGISPKYKAFTVHLGYRSMNFSRYTYSGNSFYGAGVEVAPKASKWRAQAFFGRLARALNETQNNNAAGITLYDRWAWGTKIGYGTGKHKAELILFKGWDNQNSLILTERAAENPAKENVSLGINTKTTVLKNITLNVEYAISAFTTDASAEKTTLSGFNYAGGFGGLYQPRASSQFNSAINASLNYQHSLFNTAITYRRVDPEYQTLGIPFLNNDMEDITANVSWRMFKNTVNISTNGGFQRNNLSDEQLGRTVRLIGGVTANYAASDQLNINAGYSNFNTSTVRTRIELLDSLEYYQVTTTANAGANYRFGGDSAAHAIMLMGNYQTANDIQENSSELYNGNLNYSYSHVPSGLALNAGINANINSFQGLDNFGWGPIVGISRAFFNKALRTSLNAAYLKYANAGTPVNHTINTTMNLNYRLKKKHSFGLTAAYITKEDFQGGQSFSEYRGSLKYGYSF